MRRRGLLAGIASVALTDRVAAQDLPPLRIGVLGDRTGLGATLSGPPVVVAARMAADDTGPLADGRPIEILTAEFKLRPDEALATIRRWFDELDVAAVVDVPTPAASIAVRDLARMRQRTVLNTSSVNAALTAVACAPTVTHWADDTFTRTAALARGLIGAGARTWFLVVPDMTLGLAVSADATRAIEAAGGRVVGIARHPEGVMTFASVIERARQSGAQAVGLCDIGSSLVELLRQGRAEGLFADNRKVAAFLATLSDMQSLADGTAAGLFVASSFHWSMSEQARSFARRFQDETGRAPEQSHAATYAAVRHYLRAAASAETLDGNAVNLEMRRIPLYFFGRMAKVRVDGKVLLDVSLYRVRLPPTQAPWYDCYETMRGFATPEVYRAGNGQACPATL